MLLCNFLLSRFTAGYVQDGLSVVSEARVAGEDLQGRHKRRKNKEERMKSVLEGERHGAFHKQLGLIGSDVASWFARRVVSHTEACCHGWLLMFAAAVWQVTLLWAPKKLSVRFPVAFWSESNKFSMPSSALPCLMVLYRCCN